MNNKRLRLILFIVILLFFPTLILSTVRSEPSAYDENTLERLTFPTSVPYLYLGSTLAFDVSNEGIAISTYDKKTTVLDANLKIVREFTTEKNAVFIAYYQDTLISLQDQKIVLDDGTSVKSLSGTYSSFSIDRKNNTLVAATDSEIMEFDLLSLFDATLSIVYETNSLTNTATLPYTPSNNIVAITVDKDSIFFSVTNRTNQNFDDIFYLNRNNNTIQKMYERAQRTTSLAHDGEKLFALSDGELIRYDIFDGKLSKHSSSYLGATTLGAYNGKLYMLTSEDAMVSCNYDFHYSESLFVSQSTSIGHFASPTSAYTRRGNLFVADTLNNRLFVTGEKMYVTQHEFNRINSVISDNLGNIYISYDVNKVAKLDKTYVVVEKFTLSHSINKLIIDINNNIFVSTGSGLYTLTSSDKLSKLEHLPSALDAAFVMGSKSIVWYDGTAVYKNDNPLDAVSLNTLLFQHSNIVSFAADLDANLFFFDTNGNLFKYDSKANEVIPLSFTKNSSLNLDFASSITISSIKNEHMTFGDLIFTDNARHCIYKMSGEKSGVVITDTSFSNPKIDEKISITLDTPLIYKLKENAEIFDLPIEMGRGFDIPIGSRIIYYNKFNSLEEFAFVIYEDAQNKKLISGYIFRSLIDFSSYQYTSPPAAKAVVYFNNTPIFKFPSSHSVILKNCNKDEIITLKDFAAPVENKTEYSIGSYVDNYGKTWYRIFIDEVNEGYIQADNLSVNQYIPQIRPKTNAQIKASGGIKFAQLYTLDPESGIYSRIPNELPLPEGTRVELLKTPLDPQSEFTQVRFYREDFGTLTCYVKTVHIKYDTIDTLQIVSVVALVIVITSAVVLLLYFINHKRKRRFSAK